MRVSNSVVQNNMKKIKGKIKYKYYITDLKVNGETVLFSGKKKKVFKNPEDFINITWQEAEKRQGVNNNLWNKLKGRIIDFLNY